MKNRQQKFIEKAKKTHGDRYDYSKVDYIDSTTEVEIICPEHGSFFQKPVNHVRGNTCPICANLNRGKHRSNVDEFISKAKEVHGDNYDYSKVNYINAMTKVCIICPEHSEFYMSPSSHLMGQECPKCKGRNLNTEEIIQRFKKIHGERYNYSKVSFTKMKEKVCIICPEHGEFWQTPQKHLQGQNCPQCKYDNRFITKEEFVEKANKIHNNKYLYDKTEYHSYKSKITITCPIHGDFEQTTCNHLQGCGCPKCANTISNGENELVEFLENECNYSLSKRNRTLIPPYELDIYIPNKNIAIEYNGIRWHSEMFREEKTYHLDKTNKCLEKGIRLIHIFEDEWQNKQEIVKSRLRNILNVNQNKVHARKCTIKEISYKDSKEFLDNNHIQGSSMSMYRYGLYYNNELVSLMTFGSLRKNLGNTSQENHYELLRFCNKLNTSVVGGASRLLNYFIKEHKPHRIISYCDKRWSDGNLYETLGFTHLHDSKPNYFYVINGKRENRFSFRKDILIKKYGCPNDMSEHDFMKSKGWYRIYDCGTKLYELNMGD